MTAPPAPSGAAILSAIKDAGVRHVVALPDIVTSDGLLWPVARDPDLHLIRIAKEDEGVSICAAMSYSGGRAVLLMQQTGLMDSLNAIRAIGMEYGLPVVMIVGLQGKERDRAIEDSSAYGVRIVPGVLSAMELPFSRVERAGDEGGVTGAIEGAYARSGPHCVLIGQPPAGPGAER
jgi:sulfopyruvate decarboxylase subunit beta